jgi:hypothetical protein
MSESSAEFSVPAVVASPYIDFETEELDYCRIEF